MVAFLGENGANYPENDVTVDCFLETDLKCLNNSNNCNNNNNNNDDKMFATSCSNN